MARPAEAPRQPDIPDQNPLLVALRPARALIGWMHNDQAILTLARRDQGAANNPLFAARAQAARQAVLGRTKDFHQDDLLQEAPRSLDGHIKALRANGGAAAYFNEGWTVRVADLSRVCAMQPMVFTDAASQRVEHVDPDDMRSVAEVSLPIPQATELPAQFDEIRHAWIFSSQNPNLRIAGHFAADGGPAGTKGFGFIVSLSPSFMQVAALRGRYILRDGYHRAYGLLSRGITSVPVFYREFDSIEALGIPPGMLPQDAYLGATPATLADYLDGKVAIEVEAPDVQKMLVIQGIELTPIG